MSKKEKKENEKDPRDMLDAELIEAFCKQFETANSVFDANEIWYDFELRQFFNCLNAGFFGSIDLLPYYKMELSERGFLCSVGFDGRSCYYLKYRS